jgi:hypothetical protein
VGAAGIQWAEVVHTSERLTISAAWPGRKESCSRAVSSRLAMVIGIKNLAGHCPIVIRPEESARITFVNVRFGIKGPGFDNLFG